VSAIEPTPQYRPENSARILAIRFGTRPAGSGVKPMRGSRAKKVHRGPGQPNSLQTAAVW
jgi:hypothetical protein